MTFAFKRLLMLYEWFYMLVEIYVCLAGGMKFCTLKVAKTGRIFNKPNLAALWLVHRKLKTFCIFKTCIYIFSCL